MSWTPPTNADAPLTDWIRPVPDWPQPGVLFRDLTPLWADGRAWARTVGALARPFDAAPPDLVLGIEARGFLVAAALAARWGTGLVLARKPGKLPAAAIRQDYELEYGRATLETHRDLIARGARVLIADDVIATGGTAAASRAMVEALGCSVAGFAFLVEIEPLGGREKLGSGAPVHSVVVYDGSGGASVHE
ncbi:MAG TPA: adenine phosphoribosyltransferase [Candidatus Eisenbacteria bacterium]|nr:adenine phosphoribosyltransferase [Candidatus Eisenbacteria bacterium]